jgi:hypothetical protein
MNDFTKEELHEIKKCIEWFDNNRVINFHIQLCNKIQSMIDNFCEHEWDNYYNGSINTGIYCNKCNKKLKGS